MKTEIPVQDLPLKGVELLRNVMRQIRIDPETQPQEYVLVLHARHIAQLAEEIVFLESHGHTAASPVIARAIFESLFKLALALHDPKLAAEKALREMEWSHIQSEFKGAVPKDLKKIREKPEYAPIGKLVLSLGQRWKLTTEQINSDKNHSTFWCAQKAGMVHVYQRQYAELSAFAHASADTFILRLFNITTGQVLVYATYALVLAVTKITMKYQQQLPSVLLEETQELERLFKFYDKTGHIKEYLVKELTGGSSPKPNSPGKQFEKN